MAVATKPRPSTEKIKAPAKAQAPAEPTRDDVKAAMVWTATHTNLVPTLVGPTASGKTFMVRKWAQEIGAECVALLLSQHTPDEIAGFQTENSKTGELYDRLPAWARTVAAAHAAGRPAVVFLDEFDKSREEVRGTLLTFLRDRTLHDIDLSGTAKAPIYVVAAMNPGMLSPEYMTRSLLLHVPADRAYLMDIAKHPLARRAAESGRLVLDGDGSYSNTPPPRPETVHSASVTVLNAIDASFWALTEPAQRLVLQGLVPPATLEDMLRDRLDVSNLARNPADFSEVVRSLDAVDALNVINSTLEALPDLTPVEGAELLAEIQDVIYDDVNGLLEPYMAVERSEAIRNAALKIDNSRLWEILTSRNQIGAKDGQLVGTQVDRYIAQRGEQ